MADKFNLTWHTFQTHTNELLSELYTSTIFSDVTLVCDDHLQLKAHKFVLNACSSMFRNILENNIPSPVIYLRGVAKEEMGSILQFMYLGEATLHQERMNEFMKVARDLDIKEIGKSVVTSDTISDVQEANSDENTNNLETYRGSDLSEGDNNGLYKSDFVQISEQKVARDLDIKEIGKSVVTSDTISDVQEANSDENTNNLETYRGSDLSEGDNNGLYKSDFVQISEQKVARDLDIKEIGKSVDTSDTVSDAQEANSDENTNNLEIYRGSELSEGDNNGLYKSDFIQVSDRNNIILKINQFACNQCDLSYAHNRDLRRHLQSKHKGLTYPCQQCKYEATRSSNLTVHVKTQHGGGVTYPCQYCEYKAPQPTNLRQHIKVQHHGFRYPCHHCDYQAK